MIKRLKNSFLKEPVGWITLFVTIILAALNSDRFWNFFEGDLIIEIYTNNFDGRCVDKEFVVRNEKDDSVKDIKIPIIADYFTRRGDIDLVYGLVNEMMIAPNEKTLAPRLKDLERSIPFEVIDEQDIIFIPNLNPGDRMHFTSFERILNTDIEIARQKAIDRKEPTIMYKPKVGEVSFQNGKAKMKRFLISEFCDGYR